MPTTNPADTIPVLATPAANNNGGAPEGVPAGGVAANDPVPQTPVGSPPAANAGIAPGQVAAADAPADIVYTDFTMPEGVTLAPERLEAFTTLAKAHGLDQEKAQAYLSLAAEHTQGAIQSIHDQAAATINSWKESARTDPVVGGAKYEANRTVALSAITKFGDPELTQLFDDYGLGDNPAILRFAYRVGKSAGENGFVDGQGSEQPGRPLNAEAALAARMKAEQARGS